MRPPLLLACLACLAAAGCGGAAPAARVAAASDLQFALPDINDRFAVETGDRVELVFGSSGMLARQVQNGAPFELFLSADESLVQELVRAGRTRDDGTLYAVGRLVLFAPHGSPLDARDGLPGLRRLLQDIAVPRFAIANPDHAPYGRAAAQALRTHGLWDALQPGLVLGENVSQAAQFATTGDAIGGIIAHAFTVAPAMRGRGSSALISARDHAPLRQRMVLLAGAGATAERFYQYLQTPSARAILARHGFEAPDETF